MNLKLCHLSIVLIHHYIFSNCNRQTISNILPTMASTSAHLFKLGNRGLNVSVTDYKGYVKVHMRYHHTNPVKGQSFPTKAGVTLSLKEWFDLKSQLNQIDETINTTSELMSNSNNTGFQSQTKTTDMIGGIADTESNNFAAKEDESKNAPDRVIFYVGYKPVTILHNQNQAIWKKTTFTTRKF